MQKLDLTGQRFGILVAQECLGMARGNTWWRCLCDCGVTRVVTRSNLRSGNAKSCGCQNYVTSGIANRTHGLTKHPLYGIWWKMVCRCGNPADTSWGSYGGRGITVCERWMSVENFIADMGERPARMTIERVNNNLGYTPENCRWATYAEQSRNTRRTRMFTFNGKTQCLEDWAREIGIDQSTLITRLRRHSVAESLGVPKGQMRALTQKRKEASEQPTEYGLD